MNKEKYILENYEYKKSMSKSLDVHYANPSRSQQRPLFLFIYFIFLIYLITYIIYRVC